MGYMLNLIIAILPVVIIGTYIYKKDKEKEPIKLLIKLFVGGILSALITLAITYVLKSIIPFFGRDLTTLNPFELFIYVFFGIAVIEEGCKWAITYVFSYNDKSFDELYDMILYAVFVSLGFACFENILYVVPSDDAFIGIYRMLLTVPVHCFFGIKMGEYFGLSKLNEYDNQINQKRKNLILSIIVPIIMHMVYDYLVFINEIPMLIVLIIIVILLYIYSIRKILKISKALVRVKYNYKFCPYCGTKVNSKYCPICGNKNI